jgi:triacylglycerol esterase/lipase EstA (alpha/beta hydrolase family)
MNVDENLYQCLRCFYTTNKSSTMKSHINRKKRCNKHVDSLKYSDEEILELSVIKICKRDKYKCEICKEKYATQLLLNEHKSTYCIKKSSEPNIVNITNITNNITNNIINISIPIVPFDKEWNIEHLDNYLKALILICDNKFTEFLNNILKNKVNLNVVLDKEMNNAFVYRNNMYENIDKKDLFEKSMEKIHNHLTKIKEEFYKNAENQIQSDLIDQEIQKMDDKYSKYLEDNTTKDIVNNYLSDIYDSNSKEAYEFYNKFITNSASNNIDHKIENY